MLKTNNPQIPHAFPQGKRFISEDLSFIYHLLTSPQSKEVFFSLRLLSLHNYVFCHTPADGYNYTSRLFLRIAGRETAAVIAGNIHCGYLLRSQLRNVSRGPFMKALRADHGALSRTGTAAGYARLPCRLCAADKFPAQREFAATPPAKHKRAQSQCAPRQEKTCPAAF